MVPPDHTSLTATVRPEPRHIQQRRRKTIMAWCDGATFSRVASDVSVVRMPARRKEGERSTHGGTGGGGAVNGVAMGEGLVKARVEAGRARVEVEGGWRRWGGRGWRW